MASEGILEGLLEILWDRHLGGYVLPGETSIQATSTGHEIWLRLPDQTYRFRRVSDDGQRPVWLSRPLMQ